MDLTEEKRKNDLLADFKQAPATFHEQYIRVFSFRYLRKSFLPIKIFSTQPKK